MYRYFCATAIAAGCLVMSSASNAASFDCGKAGTVFEKAICGDQELSAMDTALAAKYEDALSRLSANGQKSLREGERNWLSFVRETCLPLSEQADRNACLSNQYRQRLSDLDNAAVRVGDYVFTRVDYFSALPASKDTTEVPKPSQRQASYPAIDRPTSDVTKSFNKMLHGDQVKDLDPSGYCDDQVAADVTTDFELQAVGQKLVSISTGQSWYCHSAPHGDGGEGQNVTYVLDTKIHRLTASDLFDDKRPWREFLADRVTKALEAEVTKIKAETQNADASMRAVPSDFDMRSFVEQPSSWSLTSNGLNIRVEASWIYGRGATLVTVPWSDLKPFLVANAPVLN